MKKFKLIIAIAIVATSIQFASCERCSRSIKNLSSEFSGLHRTATLMDYTGDTIATWEGKFDIRDNGSDNQIFFDLDGKRVWIQGGIFVSEEY